MKKVLSILCSVLVLASASLFFASCSNGEDGSDGKSIVWKGSFASAPEHPEYLWAYYNTSDGCSYVWNGSEWTLLSGSQAESFDVQISEFTKEVFPVVPKARGEENEMELVFLPGKEDIPYVFCTSKNLWEFVTDPIEVSSIDENTTEVTFTNTKRNTTAVLDLTKHKLSFENYDLFFQNSSVSYFDPTDSDLVDYLKVSGSWNMAGKPVELDWSKQDIGAVICKDGDSYYLALPLQFLNDIFASVSYRTFLFNGKTLYNMYEKEPTDDYWAEGNQSGTRSEAMAEFCYNQLCLNMDFNYGLKAIHGIDKFPNFDTYFACMGLKDKLKATNAETFATALKDVTDFYIDDGHTYYYQNSHYLKKDVEIKGNYTSLMNKNYYTKAELYYYARRDKYKQGSGNSATYPIPGLEFSEDGQTAIVRFDSFTLIENPFESKEKKLSYEEKFDEIINEYVNCHEETYDTFSFIHYVNKKIKERDSTETPVKNVVLDLSFNGGGYNIAAAFVLGWMLGECQFDFTNPLTSARWTITYYADVNLDDKYMSVDPSSGMEIPDPDDTIRDKKLFCLISPRSFSCGNMVPAVLKASGRVTIIGDTSSGGSCCVQPSNTADGTLFRMSSKETMCINRNGSYYDIDQGIEPHYHINDPKNFYDIEKIDALVKSINAAQVPDGN